MGESRVWKVGVHFVKKVENKKGSECHGG